MLNLTALLTKYSTAPAKSKCYHDNLRGARAAKTTKAEQRYAEAMGAHPITAPALAEKLGISPMGCLVGLYQYEKRELVRRAGVLSGHVGHNPPILWVWVGK